MQKGVKMKTSPAPPTQDFAAGDVVFAKMKGYRHWPARIGEAKAPKNKIPIFFYGTHSTTFLFPKDVVHYWPNKKIYGQSFKRGGFDRAMWEIENDPAVGLQGQKKAALLKRLSESRRKQKSRRSVPADQNQQNTPAKEDTPPKPSAASKPPRHREPAQEKTTPPRGEEPPALKTLPLEKTTPPRGEEQPALKTHHQEKTTPPREEEESPALKTLRQEKTTPPRGEESPALKTLRQKTTPSREEESPALKTLRQKTTPIPKNLLSRRRDAAARQRHALNRKSPPTGSITELRSTRSRPAPTGSGEDEENARTRGQRSAACGAPPLPRLIPSSRPDRKRPSLHTPGEEEKKSRRRKRRKMEEEEESSQTKSRKSSEEEEPDDEERSKSLAEKRQSVLKSLQGLVTSTRGKATPTSEDTPDTSHESVKPPEAEATQSSAAKDEQRRDPSLSVTESLLYRLHGDIRISMTLENPDVSRCLSALDELSNVSVSSRNIQNHSELIDTLRKMRWFRGSEDIMFKASMLYHRFKNIYLVGDPDESLSHEYLQALQEAGPAQSDQHA